VIARSSRTVELILVINNKELGEVITPENAVEKVVVSERTGRGFAFIEGIAQAQGDVVLLLHSDTLLPNEWDAAIENALNNDRVVGGGFSLAFDSDSLYLKLLAYVADIRFHLTGEMMGDRAIFARSEILRKCLPVMDVPIFEDVRLSRRMRTYGATTLLKDHVVTSADAFRKNGMFRHLWRIVQSRLWYALGVDLERIFRYYYSEP
jgi:glycosyltransferase involved in cell wall biosynthesis